jgi:adenylate cyclase
MARESFEVYYSQNGRWQLHASYEANEREKAVEDAKGIEAKEGFPSRVVRETFNDETNTSEEVITWQSEKAKKMNDADSMFGEKKVKAAPKKRPPPPPRPTPAPEARSEPKSEPPKVKPPQAAAKRPQKPKRKKKRGGFVRFLIAILISAALSLVSGITSALVVFQMVSLGMLPPRDYTQLIIGAAVLVFFLAVFINLQRQFNILAFLRGSETKKQAQAPDPSQMLAAARKKPVPAQDVEFDQVDIEDLRAKVEADDAIEAETAEETADEDELQDLGADMGSEVYTSQPLEEPPPEVPPQPVQEAAPKPEVKAAPPQPKAEEKRPAPAAPKAPEKSPAEAEARSSLSKFISDALRTAKPEPTNAFSKFGMNLYFAGGASVIGQSKKLAKDVQLAVLKDGLVSAGNTPDRAENFCVELPTYGKNPRYTVMVQAGAKAMTLQMRGEGNATGEIGTLLTEWNLPEKRPTVPSVFTFVFTDIVGSTAMTQRLGNAGAQKAVRAHNTAVRGAIQAHRGREVKHTGDGIMAVFPDPVAAVQASIRAQREIAAHNAANPNIEVVIRVGVNVGEAVEEDNDFFGAAVQMTARICDKASKGNIWVSQAVKDACKGHKIGFIPRGQFEMKGIQGSKPLFEIGWSDAHKNELADL